MKQSVRYILFIALILVGFAPAVRAAQAADFPAPATEAPAMTPELPAIGPDGISLDEITISAKGNQIRVQNADGQTLDVYNITGVKVASHRLDSDDKTITLNVARGIYIIKVGKVARRVNIL